MEESLPSLPPAPCLIQVRVGVSVIITPFITLLAVGTVQIKLATGSISVTGAFEEADTIADVYRFVSAVTRFVKSVFYPFFSHDSRADSLRHDLRTNIVC